MADRFLVNSIQWDDDGVVSITYMDREDALRQSGNLFRVSTLSVTPESPQAADLSDLRADIEDLLFEVTEIYRDTPAWLPEETADREDDHEQGMGF